MRKKYDAKYLRTIAKAKYGSLERYAKAIGMIPQHVSRILNDERLRRGCYQSTWDKMTSPFALTPRQSLLIKGYTESEVREILEKGE